MSNLKGLVTDDEAVELACAIFGEDYNYIVNNSFEDDIDETLNYHYKIGISEFKDILNDLIKFTPTWKSSITGTLYQGFVVKENDLMRAIIKKTVE